MNKVIMLVFKIMILKFMSLIIKKMMQHPKKIVRCKGNCHTIR